MKAESVGLSQGRLERLDRVMKARYVDAGHLPGIITQVYRKGENFYEMPGDRHGVSANASATAPAKLLAVFVVDTDDKELTTSVK